MRTTIWPKIYAKRPLVSQVIEGILALKDAICTQIIKTKKHYENKYLYGISSSLAQQDFF